MTCRGKLLWADRLQCPLVMCSPATVTLMRAACQWAAAGHVDTSLSVSSFIELYRTDLPKRRVPKRQVVEPLDVVEHI